ncbi:MAG TPA: isoprenylcysteine carboxylmethyltransferase family protein [Smithella sp.]|nr:isoprenylcysteine carboxylmethyltransferase family protein [Smithella sp.]
MKNLELKIPPVAVMAIAVAAMWLVSGVLPKMHLSGAIHTVPVIFFAVIGAAFGMAGLLSFSKAKTTFNPIKPDSSTSLVTSGIYSITRNPMYVGLLSLLTSWCFFIDSAYALLLLPAFVIYMNKFQIQPEEKALRNLFGAAFDDYVLRVRRWL